MPLLHRTVKLVLATCLAIWLADFFHLAYSTSAGIIAILSVLDTRRSSLTMAWSRLLSTLLALLLAVLAFQIFGFNLLALAVYLLLYVPLAYQWKLAAGIAPCTVLVTHLYLEQSTSLSLLGNELMIFLLGAGVALIANLYMPSRQKEIDHYHDLVEVQLKKILQRFEHFLTTGDGRNDASLIHELEEILSDALQLVYLDYSNHLFHQTNYHIHYFEMRQEQNRILKDMAQSINRHQLESEESLILAELFAQTAQQLSKENSAHQLIHAIEQYLSLFRERPLPQSRQEFETRAMLLQLLRDLETFIKLKVEFYENYTENSDED